MTTCRSPVGQAALATDPRLVEWLARNPYLTDEVWLGLWGRNPSLDRAVELVAHPLNPVRLDRVLARERRISVIGQVLRHSELSEAQGRLVLAQPKLFPRLAGMWASSGMVPAALNAEVTAGLPIRFQVRSRHLFDQDEMLAALDAAPTSADRRLAAVELLMHPNAGTDVQRAAFVAYNDGDSLHDRLSVYMPDAARERRRYSFALTRPWEEADTDEELETLSRLRGVDQLPPGVRERVAQFEAARADMTLPAGPTAVPSASSSGIIGAILRATGPLPAGPVVTGHAVLLDSVTSPIGVAQDAARLVCDLLDQAGPEAWMVAVPLLADGYHGTAAELAATAAAFSAPSVRPVTVAVAPRDSGRHR